MLDLPLAQVEMIGALKNVFDTGVKTNPEVEPSPPARTAKRKVVNAFSQTEIPGDTAHRHR